MRMLGEELGRTFGDTCHYSLTEDITKTGHKASDLLDLVETGKLDLCYFSSSYLAARVPDLAVFDQPFPSLDRGALFARLDGETGDFIARSVEAATGFRVLGFWDNGVRHISNRLRPIQAPADCRDLTIRTLNNDLYLQTFRALGALPEVIDVKDLRRAVLDGVVDAQENPLTNIVTFGLQEAHRFVSMTAHFQGICLVLANRASFERLPQDIQQAMIDCIATASREQRAVAMQEDIDCLTSLEADGVAILQPHEIDRRAFGAAVSGVAAALNTSLNPWLLAQLRG
jgi:TRAP-type C4-dicarboxylate transport system substrate-binding protein